MTEEQYLAVNRMRQHAYNAASEDSRLPKAYECLACKDMHFVRVDVPALTPHFGALIPCPRCKGGEYEWYVTKHGQPPGMPAVRGVPARSEKKEWGHG